MRACQGECLWVADCLPHLGHILKCLGCPRFTHHWMPEVADKQAERAAERRASGWVWDTRNGVQT